MSSAQRSLLASLEFMREFFYVSVLVTVDLAPSGGRLKDCMNWAVSQALVPDVDAPSLVI